MQKWQRQRLQQQQRAQMKEKVASAKTTIYCSSCCKQCQLYVQLHYDYIFCAKCACVFVACSSGAFNGETSFHFYP